MITMLEKQQIIIGHFAQGRSQRQISRDLGLSRNTVKKYVDEYALKRASQQDTSKGILDAPRYDTSKRTKRKLTLEISEKIDEMLKDNDRKRSGGLAKQCMRNIDMHASLVEQGHDIGYTTVSSYVRGHASRSKEIFIRQHIEPGQMSEFDWGEVKLQLGGKEKRLMLAVFTNGASNYRWAALYYRQDMSSFLDAHVEYLAHLQSVPAEIVYDNMRTAVAKFAIRNKDKKPTEDLLRMSAYYQFSIRFCNAYKGNEKGRVERSVEYIRRKAFAPKDAFANIDEANEYLAQKLGELNDKKSKGHSKTMAERLDEEKAQMKHTPVSVYDTALVQTLKIDKYHTISVDTNHYSIAESIHGPRVHVKVYPLHIHIYDKDGQLVDTHLRRHCKYQWFIKLDHYMKTLLTKPGALSNSEALRQADTQIRTLYNRHFEDLPKVFIEVLSYITTHGIDPSMMIRAVQECLKKTLNSALTSDKIIWMIRSYDQPPAIPTTLSPSQFNQQISDNCIQQLEDAQAIF
jgi:transposase